jgi:8-oxo-dGTP pyrophosphatase MutT (NUDIX family)
MLVTMYPMGDRLRARAVENLRSFDPVAVERDDLRRAAVALVIVGAGIAGGDAATSPGHGRDRSGSRTGTPDRAEAIGGTPDPDPDPRDAAFLLTRRAAGLRAHPGQWALPGGRLDGDEDPASAARREVAEELGLRIGAEQVLGVLDDFPTRSGYAMTPVVLWGPGSGVIDANPDEVESVRVVPLAQLDHPESPSFERIPESEAPIIRMRLSDRWINAPTAAILYQFREVMLHGRPTRVAHYEQPVWAWK